MSQQYTGVVKNGAIRIQTPELEKGERVEVESSALPTDQTKTLFKQLEQINEWGGCVFDLEFPIALIATADNYQKNVFVMIS